jgi:uncharacterized membrane protein
MTDSKVMITESTKKILEEELDSKIDELSEEELLEKANASKKVVTSVTESGEVKIRQSLNG